MTARGSIPSHAIATIKLFDAYTLTKNTYIDSDSFDIRYMAEFGLGSVFVISQVITTTLKIDHYVSPDASTWVLYDNVAAAHTEDSGPATDGIEIYPFGFTVCRYNKMRVTETENTADAIITLFATVV